MIPHILLDSKCLLHLDHQIKIAATNKNSFHAVLMILSTPFAQSVVLMSPFSLMKTIAHRRQLPLTEQSNRDICDIIAIYPAAFLYSTSNQ